jgi:hypothetical protein
MILPALEQHTVSPTQGRVAVLPSTDEVAGAVVFQNGFLQRSEVPKRIVLSELQLSYAPNWIPDALHRLDNACGEGRPP